MPRSRNRDSSQASGADLVEVARVEVEAVGDLPERGHGLQRVAAFEGCQVLAVLQHPDQALITLDQAALGFAQLHAHRVLHAVTLRSPAVPMTMRSSCSRFAFSSKRGRLPFSTRLQPKRRPSCACESDLASSLTIRSALTPSRSGISTSTSISSWRPSAVYRCMRNSSISLYSRTIASTARG